MTGTATMKAACVTCVAIEDFILKRFQDASDLAACHITLRMAPESTIPNDSRNLRQLCLGQTGARERFASQT